MKFRLDLNCDMGELPELLDSGGQEALMPYLSSVNIACGAHAGDSRMMSRTIEQALHWGLNIGAHPGYPDRENFGRRALAIPPSAIEQTVFEQTSALAGIAARHGAAVRHVKAHGALYNSAVADEEISAAIAAGVSRWNKAAILVGLAGSLMLRVFRDVGFATVAEAFADRLYLADGSLAPRSRPGSVITDPETAANQAWDIAEHGFVRAAGGTTVFLEAQTLCIHGDTPGAFAIAKAVAERLMVSSRRSG